MCSPFRARPSPFPPPPSANRIILAALIHHKCVVKKHDIRKFLDGIYVSESGVIGETVAV